MGAPGFSGCHCCVWRQRIIPWWKDGLVRCVMPRCLVLQRRVRLECLQWYPGSCGEARNEAAGAWPGQPGRCIILKCVRMPYLGHSRGLRLSPWGSVLSVFLPLQLLLGLLVSLCLYTPLLGGPCLIAGWEEKCARSSAHPQPALPGWRDGVRANCVLRAHMLGTPSVMLVFLPPPPSHSGPKPPAEAEVRGPVCSDIMYTHSYL